MLKLSPSPSPLPASVAALLLATAAHAQGSYDIPAAPNPAVEFDSQGRPHQAGELLIALEHGFDRSRVLAAVDDRGGLLVGEIPRFGLLKILLPPERSAESEVEGYSRVSGVRLASLNLVGSGAVDVPADPAILGQWHHDNSGQDNGTPGADLEMFAAWDLEPGGSPVVVAVLDSGLSEFHTEFSGRLLPGYDFVDEDPFPTPAHPHGVLVAGILAANGDNGIDGSGIDRGCQILPVQVLNENNQGTSFDLLQALDYCIEQKPDVVNMSLQNYSSTFIGPALKAAKEAGCILISASGNGGFGSADSSFPGASEFTISIGATDNTDRRASFSGSGFTLDFVAPGVDVLTTDSGPGIPVPFTGTSAAAPIASGVVSLLKSRFPAMDQDCAYELLREGAEDQVGPALEDLPGYDTLYGHGRLNAFRSLSSALGCANDTLLIGEPDRIAVDAGGTQSFELFSDKQHAGLLYWIAGSTSQTPPIVIDGIEIPLALDALLPFTLQSAGSALYPNSIGFLDEKSSASASFVLPPNASQGLVGLEIQHAFIVFDYLESGTLVAASNPVAVSFFEPVSLLEEDFESGAPGWTFDNGTSGLWRLASDAECGLAVSAMATYSQPAPLCNYATGGVGSNFGTLVSPSFTLASSPPFSVELDSLLGADPSVTVTVSLRDVNTGEVQELLDNEQLSVAESTSFQVAVEEPASWAGRTVELRFDWAKLFSPATNIGWYVDNVRVLAATP